MAALDLVTSAQQALASQYNRLVNAFNNTLGITADDQVNLGKLPLPWLTSDPTPQNGLMWIRSNLGSIGRLHVRFNGVTVPIIGLRQVVLGTTEISHTITATGFTDFTNATLSIVSNGGRLRIFLIPSGATASVDQGNNAAGQDVGHIRAVVGATNLADIQTAIGIDANAISELPPSMFMWESTPAAGTYTVKLQGHVSTASGNARIAITGCKLVCEEWSL